VEFGWGEPWAWGLSLIAVTIALHAITLAIAFIGAVGLALALLHGVEAMIWAGMYVWLGALASGHDAILYSVDSMTTRGAAEVRLQNSWRLMGALEAAGGILLFGISTAFLFAVIDQVWRMLTKPKNWPR
jgi:hypothetical protein